MCGIAGYWGEGSREVLERMGRSLAHRGPDAEGYFELGPVGLAHRRLSIVDLSPTGAQPMSNKDGSITLVFNGEIYNHKELRDQFLPGYLLRGTSDTEVLLALYETLGTACFAHLRGMFAFALYDAKRTVLMLVRDQLGKKPLYWSKTDGVFLFGSELKALRAHPRCPTELNQDAVAHYLVHEYVPRASSLYRGVSKLLPGTYLTYDGVNVTMATYSSHRSALGTYQGTEEDAERELQILLERAVSKRLRADVPVGIFLSGGLDSSTIAYFAQQGRKDPVKTFSIGFEDTHFDESTYAKSVAHALGTEHYERTVTEADLLSIIEKIPQILDEPIADSSIIPTYLLSEFARTKVTVALGGDGADELFFGYDTFFAHQLAGWCERIPEFAQKAFRFGVQALPVSHEYMSLDFKLKKFVSGFDVSREMRNAHWLSAFTSSELERITTIPVIRERIFGDTNKLYAQSGFWDALQNEYLEGYLSENILVKVDRASMATGLEVRSPFLDIDIVDFALTLPRNLKLRGMTGKYILRKLMKARLPSHVTKRKKHGFNIPVGAWFRGPLRSFVTDTLLGGALVESGLFKQSELAILLQSHQDLRVDRRKQIWSLLVLELWMRKWQ